jgi:hypothetical protein
MRFAKLGLVMVLLAGCDGVRATGTPNATTPAAPSPSAPQTASPTTLPTAEPPATCPPEPSRAELVLQTGPGSESIPLDAEPLPSPASVDAAVIPIVATVLGGIAHDASVALDQGPADGLEITEATADFLPFGTATTQPVKATIGGGTVAFVLPDAALSGQLRFDLAWSGPCGTGAGTGSVGLTLVRKAVAAGCPSASDELATDVARFEDLRAKAGTLGIPLIPTGWSGRWIPGAGASDVPEFAGWDRDHAVTAAPESPVVMSETVDDLSLVGIQISIYTRADVLAFLEPDSAGELDTLAFIHRNANLKGRASVPAPLEPGSYVVEVVGAWLTPCLSLDTYSPFSLEVR